MKVRLVAEQRGRRGGKGPKVAARGGQHRRHHLSVVGREGRVRRLRLRAPGREKAEITGGRRPVIVQVPPVDALRPAIGRVMYLVQRVKKRTITLHPDGQLAPIAPSIY